MKLACGLGVANLNWAATTAEPHSLGGTDIAADVLATAITSGQSILVVGDFDADGATGTAVAVLGLRLMGCKNAVSFRSQSFEFGYGLTVPLVETPRCATDVLVTVDSALPYCCVAWARNWLPGDRHHHHYRIEPPAAANVIPMHLAIPSPARPWPAG